MWPVGGIHCYLLYSFYSCSAEEDSMGMWGLIKSALLMLSRQGIMNKLRHGYSKTIYLYKFGFYDGNNATITSYFFDNSSSN
jgi:hypothetical protein